MTEEGERIIAKVTLKEFEDFLESVTSSEDLMNAMFNDMVLEVLRNQHRSYDEETETLYFTLDNLLHATASECIVYIKENYQEDELILTNADLPLTALTIPLELFEEYMEAKTPQYEELNKSVLNVIATHVAYEEEDKVLKLTNEHIVRLMILSATTELEGES